MASNLIDLKVLTPSSNIY